MNITSLGKVVAAVTNTPVAIAAAWVSDIERVSFGQVPGSTAAVYIGAPTMNPTTGAGVYAVIPPATTAYADPIVFGWDSEDEVDLSQFAIASATVGQGCFVWYGVK